MSRLITRRAMTAGLVTGAGALLAGCDAIGRSETARNLLFTGADLHRGLQRTLQGRDALAPEYRPDQMSPRFRTNGATNPGTEAYRAHLATGFRDWRLKVDGLVRRPLAISLRQLQTMPQRAQITRHDCVEGWSAIGKWQGPRLAHLLDLAGLREEANYIVFHCADRHGASAYYESIDLVDAYHPQTILAWAMNRRQLPVGHGAPVRLRVERQLGYKHAKFVMRVEAVASLDAIGAGKGGFWEDRADYAWYAGI
ncbi:molybdopterin-dependent oxidoreductase [Stakelama tenebrarum]|uniref:Molybdopterin-dependent oxidoreductase n=1 Tax=Stakelama tenebrarum TaxID=2711215 RepID=A0A6G6Y187_9SPHN|nr:molybdopterin-dependent oxidoreductase [Sphingosinithalassobacter tenebrarum]QIG78373.1 molybdopterin-dependent oxidoreductase [Sphingosinithalassobacter tenebrarum]